MTPAILKGNFERKEAAAMIKIRQNRIASLPVKGIFALVCGRPETAQR